MNKWLLLSILIITITCYVCNQLKIGETQKEIDSRLKFLDKFSHTSKNVKFDYSKKQGVFCKAKNEIKSNSELFRIPKDLIMCSCNIFYI